MSSVDASVDEQSSPSVSTLVRGGTVAEEDGDANDDERQKDVNSVGGRQQTIRVSGKSLRISNAIIIGDGNVIRGNYNAIVGDGNTGKGDYLHFRGNGNCGRGDYNEFDGDGCFGKGDYNRLYGSMNHVKGSYSSVEESRNSGTRHTSPPLDSSSNAIKRSRHSSSPTSSVNSSKRQRGAVAPVQVAPPGEIVINDFTRGNGTVTTTRIGAGTRNASRSTADPSVILSSVGILSRFPHFTAALSQAMSQGYIEFPGSSSSRPEAKSPQNTSDGQKESSEMSPEESLIMLEGNGAIADDECDQCNVCMVNKRNVLLRPCGHIHICVECARELATTRPSGQSAIRCPTCRECIVRAEKVCL